MKSIILPLGILCVLISASVCRAQSVFNLDPAFAPVLEAFNGLVNVVVKQPDGKLLVGGYFSHVNGGARAGLARFNADGTLDQSFNTNIVVFPVGIRAIAVQPDGKILVGGQFLTTTSQGSFRNINRYNANGTEDTSFTASADSTVNTIVLRSDGKIMIGGSFFSLNGVVRPGVARLNANGSADTTFAFSISPVFAIVIQPDGNVLLGGNFTSTSAPFSRIIRVSSTGVLDSSFCANASADSTVRSIKQQADGKIVIGGSFINVDGLFHNNLARLNTNGTLDLSFNPAITGQAATSVQSLDIDPSGRIIVAGSFTGVNGSARSNIVRINSDGSLDSGFSYPTGPDKMVRAVMVEPTGDLLIGGDLQQIDGIPCFHVARLHDTGGLDNTFIPAVYLMGTVNSVDTQPDGKILAAGRFFYVNGIAHGGIVRFNADGTLDPTFVDAYQAVWDGDPINDFAIQPDGKIVVVGFLEINEPQPYAVIRLNADGTIDHTFTPVHTDSDVPTAVKIMPNGQILIAGNFSDIFGVPRNYIARLNSNGSLDTTFNPGFTNFASLQILTIEAKSNGKILVGGSFQSVNGLPRSNLVQLNSDGSTDASFTANATNVVSTIKTLADGNLLVTGPFTSINGTPVNRIAKLSASGAVDPSFNVDPNLPSAVAVPLADGRIIVGGSFSIPPLPNSIVILNPNGSINSALPNSQGVNRSVMDMVVQSDGRIVLAGDFSAFGTSQRFGLARIELTPAPRKARFDYDGDGRSDISVFRQSTGEWYLNRSTSGILGMTWGVPTDKIVPADYDGDGKTDVAVFRPSEGRWYILNSAASTFSSSLWGISTDIPAPADYDGDGKADVSIFRPSDGNWWLNRTTAGTITTQFGQIGDTPAVGDYDGDGKSDIGIFRPSNGVWFIRRSSAGDIGYQFGFGSDKVTPADYDGDGKTDIAIYRPSTGQWFIANSGSATYPVISFGAATDIPAPGDYDGDGKADIAIFRPTDGNWWLNRSTAGIIVSQFGQNGDLPTQNAYGN